MHMNAPPGPQRRLGDRRQQRVGAPLRTVGPELHAKGGALHCRRDRLDARDLLFDAGRRGKELRLDYAPRVGGQLRQDASLAAVDQRVAIAHEHGERDAHADIRGRAGDFARFVDRRHGPVKARVMRHHRTHARPRRSSEGGERAEIGIDRRHRGEPQEPGLERLARCAKGRWR